VSELFEHLPERLPGLAPRDDLLLHVADGIAGAEAPLGVIEPRGCHRAGADMLEGGAHRRRVALGLETRIEGHRRGQPGLR
jgi:hypothetical protein